MSEDCVGDAASNEQCNNRIIDAWRGNKKTKIKPHLFVHNLYHNLQKEKTNKGMNESEHECETVEEQGRTKSKSSGCDICRYYMAK